MPATAILGGAACAANLPSRAAPVAVVVEQTPTWSGFYLGGQFGYGGGDLAYSGSSALYPVTYSNQFFSQSFLQTGSSDTRRRSSGFVLGGQAGYNYQMKNNVVLGLEADVAWSEVHGKSNNFSSGTTVYTQGGMMGNYTQTFLNTSQQRNEDRLHYFGTIRARVGYAMDKFMPYIAGGLSYGEVSHYQNNLSTSTGNAPVQSGYYVSKTRVGWNIGAGVEYKITPAFSIKTEYLYSQLPGHSFTVYYPTGISNIRTQDIGMHMVRAGLNYQFAPWAPKAVLASY